MSDGERLEQLSAAVSEVAKTCPACKHNDSMSVDFKAEPDSAGDITVWRCGRCGGLLIDEGDGFTRGYQRIR